MRRLLLVLLLAGCSSEPMPASNYSVDPAVITSAKTLVWAIDGDSNPPNWAPAVDGQCTDFSFPTDSSVYFPFRRGGKTSGGGPCYRDQLNPQINGQTIKLAMNTTYTWKFQTYFDTDSSSVEWQIHGEPSSCNGTTPPIGLSSAAANNPPTYGIWAAFPNFNHLWTLPYTNKTTNNWKFQVVMNGDTWSLKGWQNGTLFVSQANLQYPANCTEPFFNFGPYPHSWKQPSMPGTYIDATFNSMELYRL